MADQSEKLSELLHFNPRWWIDPVPWWFVNQLEKNALRELAVIQLEVQKEMLAVQSKALERTLAVIGKAK